VYTCNIEWYVYFTAENADDWGKLVLSWLTCFYCIVSCKIKRLLLILKWLSLVTFWCLLLPLHVLKYCFCSII